MNADEEKLLDYSDQPPLLPPKRKGEFELSPNKPKQPHLSLEVSLSLSN